MKSKLTTLLTALLAMCLIFFSFSEVSYAWTSVTGNIETTDYIERNTVYSQYAINPWDGGYLIYVIDKDQHIVSDVVGVFRNNTVKAKYWNCDYCYYGKPLYGNSGDYTRDLIVDRIREDGYGTIPLPISMDEHSQAYELKLWSETYGMSFALDMLNAPATIETNPEDYYMIYETIWYFPLYSTVEGVEREFICGSVHEYAKFISNNLIGSAKYPAVSSSRDGLSSQGWWLNRIYTNGYFGTSICTESSYDLSQIGITTAGDLYAGINLDAHPILFSTLADKSVGLGLAVRHLSDSTPASPPAVATPQRTTTTFTGHVDAKTYNRSDSYNLSSSNNPRGRIPSGEMLINGIEVDKWYCDYTVAKHEVAPRNAEVIYTYKWDDYYGDWRDWRSTVTENPEQFERLDGFSITGSSTVPDYDNLICELPISALHPSHTDMCYGTKTLYSVEWKETHVETRRGIIKKKERKTYYYTLEYFDVETFANAEITCENTEGVSAYSGTKIVYSYDAGSSVQYGVNQNASANSHVTHIPQTKYVTIWGSSYEDCDNQANAQLDSDADRFEAHNDLFYVRDGGTTHTFLSNATFKSDSEINPISLGTYNFPDMTVAEYPQMEKNVSIPFSCPNGFYYTSGIYTYNSVVNNTKATLIRRNAPETHSAYTASVRERITSRLVQNEPLFIHTPVVSRIKTEGSNEVQLVASRQNDLLVDYQLRLDNVYSFQFDIEKHLNLLGYSLNGVAGSYSRYVSSTYGAEVKFPFDVAIVTNDGAGDRLTYYKENTWIKVDYDSEIYYYIPSWAKEMDYGEIYFRVFAYNFDALPDEERELLYNNIDAQDQTNNILSDQNLPSQHYIAYTKIAVQTSGYLYGLEVVGCNDSVIFSPMESINANNTFNNHIEQFAKHYREYKSGTKNRLGGIAVKYSNTYDYAGTPIHAVTNSWDSKLTLPFANGSAVGATGTLGRGTKIAFTVNSLSNLWNSEDKVVIKPRYRYVSADGTEYDYDDVLVLYSIGESGDKHYIEMGSDRDVFDNFSKTLLYDSYFVGTYTNKEVADTAKIYSNIHNMNTSQWNRYGTTQVLNTNGGDGINCYSVGSIVISEPLKTYTGNEEWLSYNLSKDGGNLVRLDANRLNSLVTSRDTIKDATTNNLIAQNDIELFNASMQKWYGEYYIPSNIHILLRSDLAPYNNSFDEYVRAKGGIGDDDNIFIKTGFLVLNFDITSVRKGREDLTYYKNQNMLLVENNRSANHETVYAGTNEIPIRLRDGDIAIIDMLHDVKSYNEIGVGWTN